MNLKNIEFTGAKSFFSSQLKNLGWVFLSILILIFVMQALEIKKSVDVILSSNQETVAPVSKRGVRINFENYDKVIDRIQNGQIFVPSHTITKNPFGTGK